MTPQEIRNAIRGFLYLLEKGAGSVEANEKVLSLMIDRLAIASHYRVYTVDGRDIPDPPDRDSDQLRSLVAIRFPNYGYYNTPEHIVCSVSDTNCLVGDATDDIVGIALDMYNVEWYWKNSSDRAALRHFADRYRNHWGVHLRQLQLYLFAEMWRERVPAVR